MTYLKENSEGENSLLNLRKNLNGNQIKLIAIIAMTVDHLTWAFFPGTQKIWYVLVLHVIGRLTAPIMWFFIAEGCHYTHDIRKYIGQFEKNENYAAMEDKSVITVYGMKSCPDCSYVDDQIRDNKNFKIVDIGEHVKNLKAFIRIRDNSPVFDDAKKSGGIGIPCFVLEDGTVTLTPEDVGLKSRSEDENIPQGAACRIDGTGC